jgi:hypothetical protein
MVKAVQLKKELFGLRKLLKNIHSQANVTRLFVTTAQFLCFEERHRPLGGTAFFYFDGWLLVTA